MHVRKTQVTYTFSLTPSESMIFEERKVSINDIRIALSPLFSDVTVRKSVMDFDDDYATYVYEISIEIFSDLDKPDIIDSIEGRLSLLIS